MLINSCQFTAVAGGLADFVPATAVTGFRTPKDCVNPPVVDGQVYSWRAENSTRTQWEEFRGAFSYVGNAVARTTVLDGSSGPGVKVNFSAPPRVRQVALSQDLSDSGSEPVVAKTANHVVLASEDGTQFTNGGATGTIELTLPDAGSSLGYGFAVEAAHLLKVTAGVPESYPSSNDSIVIGTQRFDPVPAAIGPSAFTAPVLGGAIKGNSTLDRMITVSGPIFRGSIDGGHNWSSSAPGGTLQSCLFLDDTSTVLTWSDIAIYRSIDFGSTWTPAVITGGTPVALTDVGCASDNGLKITLFDNDDGSFWKSTDGGANFAKAAITGFTLYTLGCDGTGNIMAFVDGSGAPPVYISLDQGATFNPTAAQPAASQIYGVTISQDGQKLITIDYGGTGVWTSPDQGATWINVGSVGTNTQYIFNTRQLGQDGHIVTMGGDGGVGSFAETFDFGATWTPFSNADFPTNSWYYSTMSSDGLRVAASDGSTIRIKIQQPSIPSIPVTIQSSAPDSYFKLKALDVGLWAVSSITGSWLIGSTTVTSAMILDTIANILALAPFGGREAFATDIGRFLIADGTSWQIDSSYFDRQGSDLGGELYSNRAGYGRDYVTDKLLANITIGRGSNPGTRDGDLRNNQDIGQFGQFQRYSVEAGSWRSIVEGLVLTESMDVSRAIQQTPIGFTQPIVVFNGDSVLLGLNGIPVIEGYVASLGAYPVNQHVDGGSF